jgi:ribonuclease-3
MANDIEGLESGIGIHFNDRKLLQQAVTHRSYLNENRSYELEHNERLEFLGDAVLELSVTDYLYRKFSNPEGDLTNWRAALVNKEMLAKVARKLDIESFLLMSRGESKDIGRARSYILANAMEALIGAVYVDQGYETADKFIQEHIIAELKEILSKKLYLDPKSYFQEKAQELFGITPSYRVISESGPDHDKKFVVGVYLDQDQVSEGEGSSKQEAQREAARLAIDAKSW